MDSTDNFVEYGTPLEPLEEEEVPSKKPVTIQDQIAVDEQGRRRFHGAFTGGFSAGYYNTVGSKEGWTPSDFKSSRQSRTEAPNSRKTHNVQDFMDEEDIGAFGIAPQILRATNDFEQRENRKRTRPGPESLGPIPGVPVLEQIIQPVKETIGIRILQRMGWKPGQGVGPRQSKAERKLEREKRKDKQKKRNQELPKDEDEPMIEGIVSDSKVYGCYMPPEFRKQDEESDSDESILDIQNVTFAPDDFEDPLCNPKENTFGLGYSGLDRTTLSFGHVDLFGAPGGIQSRVENRKLNITGEAFGIGAFEDADEEVYNRSDMAQYDFSLETPEERKARRGKDRTTKNQKVTEKTEVGIILGFIKAKNPPPQRKFFPPPPLPKDFEPKHYIRRSRFDQPPPSVVDETQKKKLGLDRHALTIEERQVLLGEEKIPLTPKEQEELEAKAKEEAEQAKKEIAREKVERLKKFTEVLQTYSSNKIPIGGQVDSSARPAFKPFMKNPEKQDRYDKYMTLTAAGFQECLKDLQPLEMTEWERERERMEFERASALYQPMGGVMSSRFVSAKSHDISHLVPTKEILQEKDPTQDPKVAAKMSLFGKLTHKTYEWHPDRLLCKRFNVPHPHPDSKMVGIHRDFTPTPAVASGMPTTEITSEGTPPAPPPPPQLPPVKKSLFDNIDFSKPPPGLLPLETRDSDEGICPPGTEDEQMPKDTSSVTAESPAEPEISKPSIDLFKEIFENSSSESEEEEPPKPPVIAKASRFDSSSDKQNSNRRDIRHEPHNSREEKSKAEKPKGVFDNLDFSKLSALKPTLKEENNEKREERRQTNAATKKSEDEDDDVEVDTYGPRPPRRPISGNSVVSKDGFTKHQTPSFLSKGHRENPISFPLTQRTSRQEREVEGAGVMWVEKKNLDSTSRKSDLISCVSKEPSKSHRHKKKKKLKERSRSRTSKSKHKKPKKQKDGKSKKAGKSKKHEKKYQNDSSSESENSSDDSSSSSSNEDSAIKIHQSFNNKALLAKLKKLTKTK